MCNNNAPAIEMIPFDVEGVALQGRNLIEASAGTGKTYSIAIMVLRLIIEKQIPIEKILMVTFTRAAVAELESRIRKFVRQAYRYSRGQQMGNATIQHIIDRVGKEQSLAALKIAVQSLDQISVMTIHSFCEHSLIQYPFETNQSFNFEMATDISDIKERVINEYWRKNIVTLEKDLYRHFTETLSREILAEVLKKALEDKEYVCEDIPDGILEQISQSIRRADVSKKAFESHLHDNFPRLRQYQVTGAALKFLNNCHTPAAFLNAYLAGYKKGTQYIRNSFPAEYALCHQSVIDKDHLGQLSDRYLFHSFKSAICELKEKVCQFKTGRDLIDFNDLISLLNKAVVEGRANDPLSAQYDAIFIDEFQDTDKFQYEIFSKLFQDRIIFYIGDPKQSIYGWRKADIATYKAAKAEVDRIYTMDLNFRSTAALIDKLNEFYSVNDPFADNQIGYNEVEAGLPNLGALTHQEVACDSFDVYGFQNKTDIQNFVLYEIQRLLLTDEIAINGERVKPSDIAIIVRYNSDAAEIKKCLSDANIPAITIDDAVVMESEEAGIIQNIMEAVIQTNTGAMNRVLLNPCFGIGTKLLLKLNQEIHLEQFMELKKIWHQSGVYNMLFRFFDIYKVRQHGIKMGIAGQRLLTNFYQITEILHQAELRSKYLPAELLSWYQRARCETNDAYEQRIESQDDAVRITTIHRCKGLTYKIVFAPYLDLNVSERACYEFREMGQYKYTYQPTASQRMLWLEQQEQENRRLIYVALTRAQYKVYLCVNNSGFNSNSSLKKFSPKDKPWIADSNGALSPRKDQPPADSTFVPRPVPPGINITSTFGIHSYSALSRAHHSFVFEKTVLAAAYDQFIFQDLGRGASVGTALHSIFEHLDFANSATWEETLRGAAKYYSTIIREEKLELFKQLVSHVMNVSIRGLGEAFTLNEISNGRKLPELEFCFSVNQANRARINEILGDLADINDGNDMDGLMTGFIDLLFEHNGRYFILDWKSNHLGNAVDDYGRDGMEAAMKGNNYHLQYMIYTLAVKRWLEARIEGFDYDRHFGGVIYVFLRGVREGQETGICVTVPQRERIEELERVFLQD